jgi:uncharacterized membrane protein YciS (DUF1049 family)
MKILKLMMMTLMMSLMTIVSFSQSGKFNVDYNFTHTYKLKTNKSESENKRLLIKHFKGQSNIKYLNKTDTSLQYNLYYNNIDVVSVKEGKKLKKYLNIEFDLNFIFNGNNIEIKSNIINFHIADQYKPIKFSELINLNLNLLSNIDFKLITSYDKIEKFINEYDQENNVLNKNDGVDILLLAENQQDASFGVIIASSIITTSIIMADGDPRNAMITLIIGSVTGGVLYISSRINKRKGLKQLEKEIKK